MKEQLMRFWKDEEGVTALEYAIVAAVLVVAVGAAIWALGDDLKAFFEGIGTKLDDAATKPK
ncbi:MULTISPECIES: Flp family type IVb pilin [Bordetella]|uniref:Flp family type IVb pilin n=2 Tax=Bordetella TaxID=517 RepID=A0A261W1L2_9BORD|nr:MULTISPECIES: Flp family type IVb pilin [Bordetella]MDM9558222.1 Flp family type IVb pilin [Bordetella petrii]OZI79760.1 Flp family type IVb pilin [Bordetella genomosp. 2]